MTLNSTRGNLHGDLLMYHLPSTTTFSYDFDSCECDGNTKEKNNKEKTKNKKKRRYNFSVICFIFLISTYMYYDKHALGLVDFLTYNLRYMEFCGLPSRFSFILVDFCLFA